MEQPDIPRVFQRQDNRLLTLELTRPKVLVQVVSLTGTQSLTSGVDGAITAWDTNKMKLASGVSYSGSRFTVASACTVLATANARFASNVTGYRYMYLRVDGVTSSADVSTAAVSGIRTGLSTSAVIGLNAGSYVELFCVQTSGGALAVEFAELGLVSIP